jgi:nucleoside 2-deoxyribosyltransferase
MNFLKNKKCYLSGPIQYGEDKNWRISPKKTLKEIFEIDVFDPFDDPKQQWVPALEEAKENKDLETMVNIAHNFVSKDLCMVDRSDLIIAYVPHKVPTIGTTHEIINSNNSKKPTLLVTDMNDITYIPLWYYGFIPVEFMFPNWNFLYQYLEKINNKTEVLHKRWKYIRQEI